MVGPGRQMPMEVGHGVGGPHSWAQGILWGSYLVIPTSREMFSQWLPVEKGTGELGQAVGP